MNHSSHDIGYLLTAYAEGTLNDEGRQWVEAQLALHPHLLEQLEAIRQVRTLLSGSIPQAPLTLDQRHREQLMHRVSQHRPVGARKWRKYFIFSVSAAVVAGVGVLLGSPEFHIVPEKIEELGRQSSAGAGGSSTNSTEESDTLTGSPTTVAQQNRGSRRHLQDEVSSSDERFLTDGIWTQKKELKKRKEAGHNVGQAPSEHLVAAALVPEESERKLDDHEVNETWDNPMEQKGANGETVNKELPYQYAKSGDLNNETSREMIQDRPADSAKFQANGKEYNQDEHGKEAIKDEKKPDAKSASNQTQIELGDSISATSSSPADISPAPGAAPAPVGDNSNLKNIQSPPSELLAMGEVRAGGGRIQVDHAMNRQSDLLTDSAIALASLSQDADEHVLSRVRKIENHEAYARTSKEQNTSPQHGNSYTAAQDQWGQSFVSNSWTTDRQLLEQVLQRAVGSSDSQATAHITALPNATPYQLHDITLAQAVVIAARRNQLQVRMEGGRLSLHGEAAPLDPTSLYGMEPPQFKLAFDTEPMQPVAQSPTMTFALNSDTSSFQQARTSLANGHLPDSTSIQPEQFINAMPLDYPQAHGPDTFALYAEAGPSPFARGPLATRTALVSVGIITRSPAPDERRPLHMTVAVDCSGSMSRPGALDRVQLALHEMVAHLHADDVVCLVSFADTAQVILPPTPGNQPERINQAISSFHGNGATNGAAGLSLAYQLAAEDSQQDSEHRVLFATDGATLSGPRTQQLLLRINGYQSRGISLMVVGCGSDDRQQRNLQTLADHAHGQHVYLASDEQAIALARGPLLPEHLQILARDTKVQVTWNVDRVNHARLIGYEQRRLNNRDFRNDDVQAGQLEHDEQVTALFEVVVQDGAAGPLGMATVRCFDTRYQSIREQSFNLPGNLLSTTMTPRLQLCACAAQLAEMLQHGWWSNVRCGTWDSLESAISQLPTSDTSAILQQMCQQSQSLEQAP